MRQLIQRPIQLSAPRQLSATFSAIRNVIAQQRSPLAGVGVEDFFEFVWK
jgi:hypothetical protein